MRKKATNEDVKQAIKKMALELRNEIIFDLNGAKFDMQEAEKKLAKTFTEEQLKLYNIFCQKRKEYYAIAQDVYKFDITDN